MSTNFTYELPAAKGKQFKPFYTTTMPVSVLCTLLQLDNNKNVLKRSQREVNLKRAKDFAEYLIDNFKKFYIIPTLIGVVSTKRGKKVEFCEASKNSNVGVLKIPMDSHIKLFDGQHRATGLGLALELFIDKLEELGFDLENIDVPVMLYTNLTLRERQMGFVDVNQNISKPQQSITDAFNTRDPLPQLAKILAEECVAFKNTVDLEHNTISKKSEFFFPLKGIKDATQTLLGLTKNATGISEEDQVLASEFWTRVSREMGWGGLDFGDKSAEQMREENILTQVATLKAVALAGNLAMQHFGSFDKVNWSKLSELNYARSKEESDFTSRIIDPVSGNMMTNKVNIDLAANLLLTVLGAPLGEDRTKLEQQYFPNGYEIKGSQKDELVGELVDSHNLEAA